jgi:hypothetical protein
VYRFFTCTYNENVGALISNRPEFSGLLIFFPDMRSSKFLNSSENPAHFLNDCLLEVFVGGFLAFLEVFFL